MNAGQPLSGAIWTKVKGKITPGMGQGKLRL